MQKMSSSPYTKPRRAFTMIVWNHRTRYDTFWDFGFVTRSVIAKSGAWNRIRGLWNQSERLTLLACLRALYDKWKFCASWRINMNSVSMKWLDFLIKINASALQLMFHAGFMFVVKMLTDYMSIHPNTTLLGIWHQRQARTSNKLFIHNNTIWHERFETCELNK